jgi:hypothetical protein
MRLAPIQRGAGVALGDVESVVDRIGLEVVRTVLP